MAKIYVSSTYLDLQDYRAQVEKTIRRMGHTDVAMEYYVAEDQRPVDKCLSDVEACDLYIGIFAWRYGWIPKKKNRKKLSITEMEYRQARKSNKPCLIFLLDGKAAWPPDFIDDDKTQVKNLRNELSESHSAGPGFKSIDELGRLATEGIHNWEKEHGLTQVITSIPEYNLEAYYTAIRNRYYVLALEGLTPPQKDDYLHIQLRQVFVEQSVRENPPPIHLPKELWEKLSHDKEIHKDDLPLGITLKDIQSASELYYGKPVRPVLDVLSESHPQRTIILGDPGSGKSTLARYVALSIINSDGDPKLRHTFEGYLPLIIELRSYVGACTSGACKSFLEFLEHLGRTEGWSLTQLALHNHLKNNGRALVVFDGLDEIFDPEQREQFTRQIVGFCNDYPKTHIIVTSRVIGYRRKILTDAGFKHFTLQDLDEKQVETFITGWYDLAMSENLEAARERRERILKSIKSSPSIRQLAGNPMLLTIMAIIGKHQELPHERWKLYEHAASVLIQHWDVNKHLKDESIDADFIGEDDKKELLRRLAFRMQGGTGGLAGNYIPQEELQAEFENYLIERYSESPSRAKLIAQAMIEQFRERNFILSLYGANLYGFVHRAFLEYFCASAFVYKFEKTKELTIEDIKTNIYGKHWKDGNWREVLRMICGMIDEKWAGEIIYYLSDTINRPWPKNGELSNIGLAGQCITEIRNLNPIAECVEKFVHIYFSLFDHLANHLLHDSIDNPVPVFITRLMGENIGSIVKRLESIRAILIDYAANENPNYRSVAVIALATYLQNDTAIFTIVRNSITTDTSSKVRMVAAEQLGLHFNKNPEALLLLRQCALEDKHEGVRWIAVETLAEYYNNEADTLPLLQERATKDMHEKVRSNALMALAEHYSSNEDTLSLIRESSIKDEHESVRCAAIEALAEHYSTDIEILKLFREYALKDNHEDVRSAAIKALAESNNNSLEILPLLRKCALEDKHEEVRSSAIEALSENYNKDTENILLFRECAKKDLHEKVRSSAIEALAENYDKDIDPDALLLFRECATKDINEDVRSSAIDALAKHYPKSSDIFILLLEIAVNDSSPATDDPNDKYYPREAAIEALTENWTKHPDTLALLSNRADNDPTQWLRDRAKELFEEKKW